MIDRIELGRACTDNDSLASEGYDIPKIVSSLGFDADSVRHVANQRALRMVLALRGGSWPERMRDAAFGGEQFSVQLDSREQDQVTQYATMWLDGLATAAKALNDREG